MCSSIDKDIEFCDAYMDISQNEKRIVRASVKTYEITGSYISIKLFKQDDNKEFKFNQKVTLTLTEFEKLLANGAKIKALLTPKRNVDKRPGWNHETAIGWRSKNRII